MDLSLKTKRGAVVSIHFGKQVTTNLWPDGWYVITDEKVITELRRLAAFAVRGESPEKQAEFANGILTTYPKVDLVGHPYTRTPKTKATETTKTSEPVQTEQAPEVEGGGGPSTKIVDPAFKKTTAYHIIKFFSEFTFTPAIRFVNTLTNTGSYNQAKEYVNNYMNLCDHPDKDAIAEKIKSDEFRTLCNDLFACKSGNVVNKRLEIYYGPAGTGKTTEAIAKYPDAKVTVCNETMDSTDLMKTFSFNDENGNPVFKPSALQEDMIAGRPHILDEINLLPLSSLRYLQGVLDGKKEIEFEGNLIQIADGFKIIGTMNLVVNGQVFNLPEPIVDRAGVLKSYEINSNILADYAF